MLYLVESDQEFDLSCRVLGGADEGGPNHWESPVRTTDADASPQNPCKVKHFAASETERTGPDFQAANGCTTTMITATMAISIGISLNMRSFLGSIGRSPAATFLPIAMR